MVETPSSAGNRETKKPHIELQGNIDADIPIDEDVCR